MYLVYIAAGMSSRFGGKPKLLAKIGKNNETLIDISINQALSCKYIKKIHFLVSENTHKQIFDYLGNSYKTIPISYSFQTIPSFRKKPWGTADAVASLFNIITEPFILCNSDDLYGKNSFNRLMNDQTNLAIGFQLDNAIPNEGNVNRGFINVDKNYIVEKLEEHLDISKQNFNQNELKNIIVSMNMFKFQPEIIKLMYENVSIFKELHQKNETIEALLPNFINDLIKNEQIEILCKMSSEQCIGITRQEDVDNVKKLL